MSNKTSLPGGYDWHWPIIRHEGLYDYSVVSVEDLYQAFKERLMAELVAEKPARLLAGSQDFYTSSEQFPLVLREPE